MDPLTREPTIRVPPEFEPLPVPLPVDPVAAGAGTFVAGTAGVADIGCGSEVPVSAA